MKKTFEIPLIALGGIIIVNYALPLLSDLKDLISVKIAKKIAIIERDNESEQLDHELDCAKRADSVKDNNCTDARSIGFTSDDFEEDGEYEED